MKRPDQGDVNEKEIIDSFMDEIWSTFEKIAEQIPHDHLSQARLAQLVKSLSALSLTTEDIWNIRRDVEFIIR